MVKRATSLRSVFLFALGLLLAVLIAPLAQAQTSWNVVQDGLGNAQARVAFSGGKFHIAWSEPWEFNAPVHYFSIGATTTPVTPIAANYFQFSNIAFKADHALMFTGSGAWSGDAAYAIRTGTSSAIVEDFNHPAKYEGGPIIANGMAYGNGVYVAGFGPNEWDLGVRHPLAVSSNLSQWDFLELPVEVAAIHDVVFADRRFMVVGSWTPTNFIEDAMGLILTSSDGTNWTITTVPSATTLQDVVYTGGEWLTVGDGGTALRSVDGHTWEALGTNGLSGNLTAVQHGNGYYLVGTDLGTLYSSGDASNWVLQAKTGGQVHDIAVAPGRFVAACTGRVLSSNFSAAGIADIISQPEGAYVVPNEQVTLAVTAVGNATLSYQWYAGVSGDTSNPVVGATSATFQTPPLSATASYWVRVSNGLGSENSVTARLTMQLQPVITNPPDGQVKKLGDYIYPSVSVSGYNMSYQWYEGWTGDTSTPLIDRNNSSMGMRLEELGTFYYWVRCWNGIGQVDSVTVEVVVEPVLPVIYEEPLDATTFVGDYESIIVRASGPLLSYQWYAGDRGDTSVPVSGTSSYYAPPRDTPGEFSYWVRVSNAAGYADSRAVSFTVVAQPPMITRQPEDERVKYGGSVYLSVSVPYASGTTYQWFLGMSGDASQPVVSATSSYYYPSGLAVGEYHYWVRVTNPSGTTDSNAATVTVDPAEYASWLGLAGLPTDESGDGSPDALLAGDGVPNLVRYLMGVGASERIAGTGYYRVGVMFFGGESYATLRFRQRTNVTDASLVVEESSDLANWDPTAVLVSTLDHGDGTVTYVYRTSGTAVGHGYLRLNAVRP